MFLWDTDTKIFVEEFWDKIFDTEVVTALGHVLINENYYNRNSAVKFFTVAMAQGVLHLFMGY